MASVTHIVVQGNFSKIYNLDFFLFFLGGGGVGGILILLFIYNDLICSYFRILEDISDTLVAVTAKNGKCIIHTLNTLHSQFQTRCPHLKCERNNVYGREIVIVILVPLNFYDPKKYQNNYL